jgi:hypothetical protein
MSYQDLGEPRLIQNGARAVVARGRRVEERKEEPVRRVARAERSRSRRRGQPGDHSRNIRERVEQRRREMREQQRNNLRPVQDGVQQSRWVTFTITGRWDYYESGVHHEDQSYEDSREEQRLIKFNSRADYHHKLHAGIEHFKTVVQNLEDDYWVISWISATVDDGYVEEDMRENAEDEEHIGIQHSEPIDNRFLKGADVNRLTKADKNLYKNCLLKEFILTYQNKIPTLAPERGGVEKCCEIMGISVEEVAEKGIRIKKFKKLCDHYKIGLLAINHFYRLVIPRIVYEKSKYATFACYVYDAHCYPIADKAVKSNLSHSFVQKNENTKVVKKDTSKAQQSEVKDELIQFSQEPLVDVDVSNLDKLADGAMVFYHQKNLKELLVQLLEKKNTLYVHKHTRTCVSSINYDRGIKLYCNPNHRSKLDWTDTMRIAKVLDVPFKNQSISALSWEHMNTYYHPRGAAAKRESISKTLREYIIMQQESICNHCNEVMARNDIEINHIRPVSNGGLTIRENLEALHTACHAEISSRQAMERLMNIDNSMSYYNDQTFEIFNRIKTGLCHNFVDIDQYIRFNKEKRVLSGLDMNKCRRNMLRYSNIDDWCCYSILDSPVQYDSEVHKELPRGFYFVESDNILPLQGNGWYSVPMIRYCLKHKIIKESQIKFALLASMHLPAHYFHKWIDYIVRTFTDPQDASIVKLMVNGLIGMWAARTSKFRQMRFFNVEKAANADVEKRQGQADTSFTVTARRFDKNDADGYDENGIMIPQFYEATWNTTSSKLENHMPLFMQCLDLERVECHRVARRIEKAGGIVCHVNTDAVLGYFKTQAQADLFQKDAECIQWTEGVPKYKKVSGITEGKHEIMVEASTIKYTLPTHKYHNYNDPMYHDFDKYSTKMLDKLKSFILEAPAGCGKTTLLLSIIKELTRRGKRFLVTAPTHQAKKLLSKGGHPAKTIHSALSSLKHGSGFHRFASYDYIIVDECSMISEPLWLMLCRIKQKCPNVRFIIAGCFKQLPPVEDRVGKDFNYQDSYAVHWLVDGVKQHLSVNRRGMGDPEAEKLFKMYMNPSTVDTSLFGTKECPRSICYTNSKRKQINIRWMKHFAAKAGSHMLVEKAADGFKHNQDLMIYEGLPLIACRTRSTLNICNADRLVVIKYSSNNVTVRHVDEDGEQFEDPIKIPVDQIAVVCQPGYASTLHRQQGASIGEEYTLYEWEKYTPNMAYVALSRTRRMKHINIVLENEDGEN